MKIFSPRFTKSKEDISLPKYPSFILGLFLFYPNFHVTLFDHIIKSIFMSHPIALLLDYAMEVSVAKLSQWTYSSCQPLVMPYATGLGAQLNTEIVAQSSS